jgi:hypothetical protein
MAEGYRFKSLLLKYLGNLSLNHLVRTEITDEKLKKKKKNCAA